MNWLSLISRRLARPRARGLPPDPSAARSTTLRRPAFIALVSVALAVSAVDFARAAAVPTIGLLVVGKPDPAAIVESLRAELRKLGYVEGRSIHLEVRSAAGNLDRLPALAGDLVRDKVDVIGAWMTPTVLAAKGATKKIPIVMIGAGDPVGMGIVASLARPGGNITGLAAQTPELAAKQVELLKGALPSLRRIAALCNAPDPFSKPFLQHIERAGKTQDIEIVAFDITPGPTLDGAFPAMVANQVGGSSSSRACRSPTSRSLPCAFASRRRRPTCRLLPMAG